MRVGSNTTTTLPASTIPKNVTSLFPPGYAIHSTSSFSQQANAVVQTSTTQYQLPTQATYQPPLSSVSSITFTATQAGLSGQGSLAIDTYPNVPVTNVLVTYSYDVTHVHVGASAQVHFSPSYSGILSSETAFNDTWTATFGNLNWTGMIKSQIQNATLHTISVTTMGVPPGFNPIIQSALALTKSESLSLTYTGSTRTLILQSTTTYVPDLDSQVNNLKNQFFQLLLSLVPGTALPPWVSFIQSTSVAVSQISTTSDFDLNASTARMTFQGLVLKPPTVGSNTNFTIPGLFQTLGAVPEPAVNITLVGGSNSSYTVKVIVPSGTTAPSSMTANSATWTNVQNATVLSAVRFELVATPSSFLAILVSPPALALEGVAAVAIVAGALLLLRRRRRLAPPAPGPVMGPAPTPEPGPVPTPLTP